MKRWIQLYERISATYILVYELMTVIFLAGITVLWIYSWFKPEVADEQTRTAHGLSLIHISEPTRPY